MILIALGANLHGRRGSPLQTLKWAMGQMANDQIYVISVSSFYSTRAIGQKGQPDYVNAVVRVASAKSAENILKNLKRIESRAGRANQQMRNAGRWAARTLDLDIIDYNGRVSCGFHVCSCDTGMCNGDINVTFAQKSAKCGLVLPHPRAHHRPFVIQPISDIYPFWHHPVYGLSAVSMAAKLRRSPEGRILHKIETA